MPAQQRHGGGVGRLHVKGRSHGPRTRDEETHRLRLGNGLERRIRRGKGERVDRKQLFAAHLQWRTAGGQHLNRGASRHQRHHQVRCGIQNMLTVIQDHEASAEVAGPITMASRHRSAIGAQGDLEDGCHRGYHQAPGRPGVTDRPRPHRRQSGAATSSARSQGEPGLADATGTGQGQERDGFVQQQGSRRWHAQSSRPMRRVRGTGSALIARVAATAAIPTLPQAKR